MTAQVAPFNSLKTVLNFALNGDKEAVNAFCQRLGVDPNELFQYFCQVMEYGSNYDSSQPLAEKSRSIVLRKLEAQQAAPIEDVADELGLSVRSLQRRLKIEQVTFREIIDEARKEMALRLISTNQRNINEIACVMGYNEPASFRRAFKKWTGHNPKAYQLGLN